MSLQPSVGGGSSPRKGKYELIGGSLQAEEHGTVGEGICVGTGSIRQARERPGHGWGGLQIEYGIGPASDLRPARLKGEHDEQGAIPPTRAEGPCGRANLGPTGP